MQRSATQRLPSACPHDCPSTCALEVERIDEHTIGRIYGAKDNPYTDGVICAKVARYAERIHHPDRLLQPLRRTGPKGRGLAAFTEIGWDEALDQVAERFLQARRQYGSESIWPYHYAGTMGLVQRDGLDRLRHLLQTSRQHSTFCTALADAGWIAGSGKKCGSDPRTIADSDLIVVWGGNPVNTQINVMHHIAKARRLRGARLVVVDPYRTGTAAKADLHLMLRPGSDAALACAVMHVLFRENLADRAYLAQYTDAPAELERHLQTKTPQWAAAITGLDAAQIVAFARLYGETPRSFIRIGYGFSRSYNGAANMHAVSCLPAVSGAWQHHGGGALYGNTALYEVDQTLIKGSDYATETRIFDQSRIGAILCNNPHDLQGGPPVHAMLIQNTNPLVVAPDSTQVRAGMMRPDLFLCVHEQFMTETAAMADIVLPATMFLEHDDLYQASGHCYLQTTRKLIEPPGACRSNHWVLCQLAARLGLDHPAFAMDERELIDTTLRASGLPGESELYAKRWHDCSQSFADSNFLNGFATADGKFHFKPDWRAVGQDVAEMPALPDYMPPLNRATAEHPFRLVTAPARHFLNTSFTETSTSRRREATPTLLIHPQDCAELQIGEGDRVRLSNAQASVLLRARAFDGLQRGVIVAESIWLNADFEGNLGINALTTATPGKPNGGALFHDTAVSLQLA